MEIDSDGVATISTDELAIGDHVISALYSGDDNYNQSDDALIQTVDVAESAWSLTNVTPQIDPLGTNTVSQTLDLDDSPGTSSSGDASLTYNSATVNVRPVVEVALTTDPNADLPDVIDVALYLCRTEL